MELTTTTILMMMTVMSSIRKMKLTMSMKSLMMVRIKQTNCDEDTEDDVDG